MKPEILYIIGVFVFFACLEAWRTGFFKKKGQRSGDGTVELVSGFFLMGVTQPLVLAAGAGLVALIAPEAQGSLSDLFWGYQLLLLLVFDDLMQYSWHRAAHTFPWLYPLHRPHHEAQYLSIRVVYRNNNFYYLAMPSLWFSGALIFLGLELVYAYYIAFKMTVITAAHSDVPWDKKLYAIPALHPLMWIIERTISTPSTHAMHHGRHKDDPGTNYKGNYGNLLFFWDVLFGTAKISRQYPSAYGVENLPETSVGEQLAWPLIRGPKDMDETAAPAQEER